jgi:hypothetical protein
LGFRRWLSLRRGTGDCRHLGHRLSATMQALSWPGPSWLATTMWIPRYKLAIKLFPPASGREESTGYRRSRAVSGLHKLGQGSRNRLMANFAVDNFKKRDDEATCSRVRRPVIYHLLSWIVRTALTSDVFVEVRKPQYASAVCSQLPAADEILVFCYRLVRAVEFVSTQLSTGLCPTCSG